MGLLNFGLRIVMDIAIPLPVPQPLHERGHGIPEMKRNPKISMGFRILERFQ